MAMRAADRDGRAKAPNYSPEVTDILKRAYRLAQDVHNLSHAKATELAGALDRVHAHALVHGYDVEGPLEDEGIDWTLTDLNMADGVRDCLPLDHTELRGNDDIERLFDPSGESRTDRAVARILEERAQR